MRANSLRLMEEEIGLASNEVSLVAQEATIRISG